MHTLDDKWRCTERISKCTDSKIELDWQMQWFLKWGLSGEVQFSFLIIKKVLFWNFKLGQWKQFERSKFKENIYVAHPLKHYSNSATYGATDSSPKDITLQS